MTERQYNSKLLGDKLSQLPVPPNEALWSRIEAQLLAVPPTVQQPPAKPLPQPNGAKAALVKTAIAVVATILVVAFIIWRVNKKTPSQQHTPAVRKIQQHTMPDSTKATPPIVLPVKPTPKNKPLVKPGLQPALLDTQATNTPLLPNRKAVDLPLRDSMPAATPPAAAVLRADSVKIPAKKDEGYYFEVKKKKG